MTLPTELATPPIRRADSVAIIAVVQGLFDGMARRDTAALRALLASGTEFISLRVGGTGEPAIRRQSDTAFLRSMASGGERLLERMWSPAIRVAGPIAEVWTMYDFHRDGRFSHCGVDSFTLLRTGSRWRLVGIVYTVQTEGCPPSPLGRPE